jgi:Sulfotransferase family
LRARTARTLRQQEPKRFVFVVSGGRSGSTLVQGLLNALPGTLVRGENSFYILPIFRAYRGTQTFQRKYGRSAAEATSAFYGLHEIDLGDFVRSTRRLALRQLFATVDPRTVKVLGFKEVRWEHIRPNETEAFFDFFEKVFPNALYVLNERDPQKAVRSGQWLRTDEKTALKALARVHEVQRYLRESRRERTYDTRFEVITGDDDAVRDQALTGLAEFVVGSCDDELLARLHAVLKVGHGPFPFGRARRERAKNQGDQSAEGAAGDADEARVDSPAGDAAGPRR